MQRQHQALEEEEQAPPSITNKCSSATTKRQSQSSNESANPEVEEISSVVITMEGVCHIWQERVAVQTSIPTTTNPDSPVQWLKERSSQLANTRIVHTIQSFQERQNHL